LQPPQLLQPGQVDNRLQQLFAPEIPPALLVALKAGGAVLLLVAGLLVVARAAAHWRRPSADADASGEERDSLWAAGRLRRLLLGLWRRLFGRGAVAAGASGPLARTVLEGAVAGQTSSVRELYRELLRLGESAGAPRGAATTPLEHLPSLQQALEPAADAANLTRAYLDVRYAEVESSPAETQDARNELERLRPRFRYEDS
jgi:hypothetical protein